MIRFRMLLWLSTQMIDCSYQLRMTEVARRGHLPPYTSLLLDPIHYEQAHLTGVDLHRWRVDYPCRHRTVQVIRGR